MTDLSRTITPVLILALACLQSSGAMAADDEALFKACPELKSWAATHPHRGEDASEAAGKPDTATSPELREELKQRVAADQRAREQVFERAGPPDEKAVQALLSVDKANLDWLKQTLAEHGFPTVEQVGEDGVSDAFLLVQHADADPALQQSVLEALRPRLDKGGIRKSEFAMLTDRVLVAQKKPQRFGTQFKQAKEGGFELSPTEDMGHLEERRQQMDLMPLPVYECVMRATYSSQ